MANTWMGDWTGKSDDDVFSGAGEEPGSQASYWRQIEMQRRLYLLQRQALEGQLEATVVQREATEAQKSAIEVMKSQSRIMLWSVIGIFATAIVTLIAAFIPG